MYCAIDDCIVNASPIFETYPAIDAYLEATILSVDRDYRSIGIGKRLMEQLTSIAVENNLKLVLVQCTNVFSFGTCLKLGYHQIAEVPYIEMKIYALEGFPIPDPHKIYHAVVKEL